MAGTALLARSQVTHGWLAAVVDGFDLMIHEAGHPIAGLLGWPFLTFLGGTLAQLTPPVLSALAFWRTGQGASAAAAVVWAGVNLVNVGTYAADAEARALPLLGAGPEGHDWWNMLGMLGLRAQGGAIGGIIQALGWALQVAAPAWAVAAWLRRRLGEAGTR